MNTLRTLTSSHTPHGTVYLPHQRYDAARLSPYHLEHESGKQIPTQWDHVASLADGDVVQLTGISEERLAGQFAIVPKPSHGYGVAFFPDQLTVMHNGGVFIQVDDYPKAPICGLDADYVGTHRQGSGTLTMEFRNHLTEFLSVAAFWTFYAFSKEPELELLFFSRAGIRGYFSEIKIIGATPTGIDPAISMLTHHLVKPDVAGKHVFPQRAVRPMRVRCWLGEDTGETPLSHGWGTFKWDGGYLAQSLSVPTFTEAEIAKAESDALAYVDLFNRAEVTDPGYDRPPPNFFWKTRGGYYGGFTGGIDRFQMDGLFAAASGKQTFLEQLQAQEVEDFCRQPGIRFQETGDVQKWEDIADENGQLPFTIYSNRIIKGEGKDNNWYNGQTGECGYEYDLARFEPHDYQHGDRIYSQSAALVWLTGSPMSKRLLHGQCETWTMQMPRPWGAPDVGEGTYWGRGEAWGANAVATCATFVLGDKARFQTWLDKFADHLSTAQLPTGLWCVKDGGKVATAPPFGHALSEPCRTQVHPEVEGNESQVADFRVGRANENVALMFAVRAIAYGLFPNLRGDLKEMIRKCAHGLADYAWLGPGVRDRYVVAEQGGRPFTSLEEMTPAAEDASYEFAQQNNGDGYFVGNALQWGIDEGAEVVDRVCDWAGVEAPEAVLGALQGRRKHDVGNWGHLFAAIQARGS